MLTRLLTHIADILISTPLRLVQMLREGAIRLDQVQWLVIDEADRLLDDGFDEQVIRT